MKKIALITILLCASARPALAQQQNVYTGGMKYTTMRRAQPNDNEKSVLYNRKPAPTVDEETAPQKAEAPKKDALPVIEPALAKETQETVWDKYRELAEGKKPKEKTDNAPQKPSAPEAPQQQAEADNAQATGLGAILQGYQRSKEKRGQMKSIRFSKPEVNKPSVKKPSVEKPKNAEAE